MGKKISDIRITRSYDDNNRRLKAEEEDGEKKVQMQMREIVPSPDEFRGPSEEMQRP